MMSISTRWVAETLAIPLEHFGLGVNHDSTRPHWGFHMTLPSCSPSRVVMESALRILLRHRFCRDGQTRSLIHRTVERLRRLSR